MPTCARMATGGQKLKTLPGPPMGRTAVFLGYHRHPVAPETCRLNGTNYRCLTEVQAVGTAPRIDFNEPDMGKTLSLSQFCLARRALQLTLSRSSVFHQLNRVAFADKARLDDGAVERHSPVKLGSHLRFRVLC